MSDIHNIPQPKSRAAKLLKLERAQMGGRSRWEAFCVICDQNDVRHVLQTDSISDFGVGELKGALSFWRYTLEKEETAASITAGGVASALGNATATQHALTSAGLVGAVLKPIVTSVRAAPQQQQEGTEWGACDTIIKAAAAGDHVAINVLHCVYVNTNRWCRYSEMGLQSTAAMFRRLRKPFPTNPMEFPMGVSMAISRGVYELPLPDADYVAAPGVNLGARSQQRRGGLADIFNPTNQTPNRRGAIGG